MSYVFSDPQNESHLRRFDDLFRPLVMAILVSRYRKDPAFVEDAYQSAFIKYIEIFSRGKKDGVVYEAYFVAIAKNSLLDEPNRKVLGVTSEPNRLLSPCRAVGIEMRYQRLILTDECRTDRASIRRSNLSSPSQHERACLSPSANA